MELAHIVRTTHHDTGTFTLLCGEERAEVVEPGPGAPTCGACTLEALNVERRFGSQLAQQLVEADERIDLLRRAHGRMIDYLDEVNLRLAKAEKRIRKMKRDR